jgi:6-O-methylguanine DNA methyltransferase, DNA binding domain
MTAIRDVGAAVGRNPLCVIIPCHRVVGATGKLTGYVGGLDRKRALLEIEHAGALRAGRAAGHSCGSRDGGMPTGKDPRHISRDGARSRLRRACSRIGRDFFHSR